MLNRYEIRRSNEAYVIALFLFLSLCLGSLVIFTSYLVATAPVEKGVVPVIELSEDIIKPSGLSSYPSSLLIKKESINDIINAPAPVTENWPDILPLLYAAPPAPTVPETPAVLADIEAVLFAPPENFINFSAPALPLLAPPAGSFIAWGYNGHGQLGTGNNTSSNVITTVTGITNAVSVAAGNEFSLALKSDGTVWSTGYNYYGQLGDGTNNNSNAPVQVSGLNNVIAISANYYYGLALKNDGTVWAWGYNGNGQFGNTILNSSNVPVQVSGISGVTAISAGYYHGLALKTDGSVWAWGYNGYGQFGTGNYTNFSAPVQVIAGNATAIAAGLNFSVVVLNNGTVQAAGDNSYGRLGNGSTTGNFPNWATVSSLSGIVSVATGNYHGLAIKNDGTVWAWGNNNAGQVGNGTFSNLVPTPVQVSALVSITQVSGGDSSSFARRSDGTVWAWGQNYYGQLGIGPQNNGCQCEVQPVKVPGSEKVIAVAAGTFHVFAATGTVNTPLLDGPDGLHFGQQVTGTAATRTLEINNRGLQTLNITAASIGGTNASDFALSGVTLPVNISPGGSALFTVTVNPGATGFRLASLTLTDNAVEVTDNFILSAYGVNTAPRSGAIKMWGYNGNGELGTGNTTTSSVPTTTVGLPGPALSIIFGNFFSYALLADGTVWAWGSNSYGQLGNDTYTGSYVPVQVKNLSGIVTIMADHSSNYRAYAIRSDGTLWGWGQSSNGLGLGTGYGSGYFPQPVKVLNPDLTPFTGAIKILGFDNTQLAIKEDGAAWVWGENYNGQFGNGTTTGSPYPASIAGTYLNGAIGRGFTVLVKTDGSVVATGLNSSGQLGNGTTVNSSSFVTVTGLTGMTRVSASVDYALALKNDGTVWAWGKNNYGQLGIGRVSDPISVPVQIPGLSGVVDISASEDFALVLKSDGTAWTWGRNHYGQLGIADKNVVSDCNCVVKPVKVEGVSRVIDINGGYPGAAAVSDSPGLVTASLSFNIASLDFGYGQVLQSSAPVSVTITNNGAATLIINSANTSGGNNNDFALGGVSFPINIAPGASVPVTLTFTAGAAGFRATTLQVNSNAPDSPHYLPLSGLGVAGLPQSGQVWDWGYNDFGQLGPGISTGVHSNIPINVTGLPAPAISVKGAGERSSYALLADGSVWAWGYGTNGQLGNGANTHSPTPVKVVISGVIAIAAGRYHALALKSDGTVWAWGQNDYGRLGNGGGNGSNLPVQVLNTDYSPLTGVKALASFDHFSLALKTDGTVWAWGSGTNGTIGNGTNNSYNTAVPVNISGTVVAIATGVDHSLAVKGDGTVWAWGNNSLGQLGNGTTVITNTPQLVPGLTGITTVAGGYQHTLALKNDGTVWAWGSNSRGQLGYGTVSSSISVPVKVQDLQGVQGLSAGDGLSMARKTDGTLWVWGRDNYGQSGNGPQNLVRYLPGCQCQVKPYPVDSVTQVVEAGTGWYHGLAITGSLNSPVLSLETASLDFSYGVTGIATSPRSVIVKNRGNSPLVISGVAKGGPNDADFTISGTSFPLNISPGATATINLTFTAGGQANRLATLQINSNAPDGPRNLPMSGFGVSSLPAGGSVLTWGQANLGQLGNGSTTNSSIPVPTNSLPGTVIKVKSGIDFSIALLLDGTVWGWGLNSAGQLGTGVVSPSITVPVQAKIDGVIELAISNNHVVALKSDGSVWTWGYGGNGNLGNSGYSTSAFPVQVRSPDYTPLAGVKGIYAGGNTVMAVKQDGTLVGWGYNGYGQLGIGNTTDQAFAITTQFTGTIKSVGMGYFHTVVVKDDGSVWSVGRNNYGQLGDGTVTPNKTSPVQIYPPGSGFVAASAGDSHSAVLKSDGTVWTWGRNTYGQLGDGTITDRSVPEKALALNNVVELAIDGNWSMARRNDGTIWTWGYDYNGELGNGPAVLPYYNPACYCQTNPRRVPGVSQILGIGTGENHGAAVVGTISTPIFGFEAQSLDFGFGQVGQATGSHGLVISNTGTTTLTITGAAISGGNNLEFAVTGPAFPFNISPGATATLNLSFTAGGTGIRNSNVTVSSTAPDSPQTLPLSGFGVTNLPSAGAVIDWGYNAQGQLGNNSTTSSSTPVAPQGLPAPVISVSGGNEYSLALLADGSVWAWGYNNHGAIGNGLINSVIYTNPVKTNIKGVIALASGGYHALALKSDGSVWAWGYGGNGTLGYGLTINTGTPQPVLNTDFSAVKGVKAIAAGNDFSLLLKNDGTVWAFGSNNYGQLGLGNTSSRYNPVQVPLSGTVTAVSAGGYHSLALKSDGTVLAWGRNDYGQLGDGSSTINRTTAVPVAGLSNITGLGAGGFHSLAVKNDGTAWAWGLNDNAQLGTGNIINQNTPVQIPTLRGIAGLYGSYKSSMALKQDGTIWTWGQNQYNELGDGGVNNPNYHNGCACKVNPERQPGTGQVVSAAYGYYHGIAVTGSITRPVYSAEASLDFGKQPLNQTSVVRYLVISNTGQSSFQINSVSITGANAPNFGLQAATLPLIVPAGGSVSLGVTFTPDALNSRKATMSVYGNMVEGYQDIPLSGYGIAGTLPAGSVKAWGQGTSGELGNGKVTSSNVYTSVNTLGNVVKIASGDNHSIALLSDGTVWGWGQNHLGQLGLGNLNTPISVPVQILNLKGIIDIAAADDHSYAIRSDGTLFGWGENADYELGQGHTTNKNRPVPLLNSDLSIFKDAALVMAGTTHSYLQKQDGSWWAWAKNQYGQLGLGNFNNQPHPVLFNTLPGVTAIVPGDFHTVALVGQTVYAWGLNTSGQVGNGGTGNVSSPVQVSSMTGVKAIGAGLSHSLSVKNDGTVWAWGENANGQVTIGTTDALVPVQVGGLAGVTAVTGGGGHSYALKGDGTVWAWGANGNGQLGRGNFTNSNGVPVQVIGLTGAGQVTANNNSGLALIAESIARIGFSPASLQFINTAINTPSQSRVVTLTNTGSSALTVSSITIGGQNPTDFSLTVNTSLPKTLNPGEFFTVSLIFNTPAAGQRKATMVVTDNAPDSPQNYSLTGFVDPSTLNWNWVDAQALTLAPDGSGNLVTTVDQFISQPDGSKWFKVTAGINSRVAISISSANGTATLPADYDLAVYKDLAVSYQQEILPKSLVEIATKAAPYQFLPYQFLPYQFLPYQFLPYQFLPYQFLPYQFLPYQFLPSDKMGESHLPFSMIGDTKIPNGYQPEYYNTVIRDGLLSLSMRDGLSPEQTSFNTFNNTGDLYIRVRSAAGATSIENPFRLQVVVQGGSCAAVTPVPANIPNPTAIPGNYKTVILTDLSRISGTSQEKSTMLTKLNLLANRPEVNGIVLDLSDSTRYQRVISANLQADSNRDCPFAKNIVAQEIKKVVDLYRTGSLQYVVLTGPDSVIPFVRYPDKAGFAPESDFVPVLKSGYPAQAALKNNQYLGQDAYGAKQDILFTNNDLPVADLAVGRLVESAAEVTTMVDAYTLANGVVSPQSALATGYDFVSDVAVAVKGEFEGIMNPPNCGGSCKTTETLIQGYQGTGNWTATELRNKLLGNRHDLVFLAGHFSPGYALAADNNTSFSTTELNASSLNLTNVILMSVGCHSGYNIPGEDSIAGQSEEPDWAQTLNRKGITGIIGTGYQYGDTELIDYSERLYLNMVQQMRLQPPNGLSGMPLGMAFQQAKKLYLSRTSPVNSLHTKVVLEATLYGLPMLQVSAGGINTVSDPSIAGTPTTVGSGPGQALGLATTDYTLTPNLTTKTVNLTNAQNNSQVVATYLTGKDNVVMNGLDPVLPLDTRNAGAANYVLRGVGFRGGNYSDISNIFPLTAGTATEYGRSRVIFQSNTLYPSQPWSINYKEAEAGGNPRLNVIPAQYRSSSPGSDTGILRQFNNMDFRLFYSNYSGVAARAGAPEVKDIKAIASGGTVTFSATVTGPVSAGIQAVWVTYTIEGSGVWQSIDLTSAGNGNWSGNLPLNGQDYAGIRYIVQAVNGVGVVSLSTNSGQLYTPTPPPPPPPPAPLVTSVTILQAPGTIDYLSSPVISAEVKFTDPNTNNQQPLAGVPVIFEVGDQRTAVTSDASGQVWLNYNGQNPFQIKQSPGSRSLNVNYAGNSSYAPSLSSAGFTINKIPTSITLNNTGLNTVQYSDPLSITATLRDINNNPVGLKWLVFVGVDGNNNTFTYSAQTNSNGVAQLLTPQWPAGVYSYTAYFAGQIPGFGTLSDSLYGSSSQAGVTTITIGAENSAVSYIGPATLNASAAILTGKVTQEADNWPGNLSLAQIKFDLYDSGDQLVRTITTTTAGDGVGSATIQGLAAGNYNLRMTVTGGFFSSTTAGPVALTIIDPAACLTVNQSEDTGTGACGTLSGAISAANSITGMNPVTITLSGITNLNVKAAQAKINNSNGARIVLQGTCSANQPVTTLVQASPYTGDGLVLGDKVTLSCIKISGFSGYGLVVEGKNNELDRTQIEKSGRSQMKIVAGGNIKARPTGSPGNNRFIKE